MILFTHENVSVNGTVIASANVSALKSGDAAVNETITIKDVARLSGVGISTVSRVLNGRPDVGDETKRKVMEVVEREGYIPNGNAKHLKQKRTDIVAVIIRGMQNVFLSAVVERLQKYIEESGFKFLLYYIDEKSDEFITAQKIVNEKKVQGIIFLGGCATDKEDAIRALDIPCVFSTIGAESIHLPRVSSVTIDNKSAARLAVEYLINSGHKKIAVLGGEVECDNAIGQRYTGAIEAMKENGIEFSDDNYISSVFSFQSAYDSMMLALKNGKSFTAVFAMSDIMAIGAAKAIIDFGLKVPEDVSIIGFDGIELAKYYNPTLATIHQPKDLIARKTVELLVASIKDPSCGKHIMVESKLIMGGSVRNLRG